MKSETRVQRMVLVTALPRLAESCREGERKSERERERKREREREISHLSHYKGTNPIMGAPPS